MLETKQALSGKALVVIGGTTGLGRAGAIACVAAGARVVVVGRSEESLREALAALGPHADGIAGDAVDPETADRAIELSLERFGGFDGIYHVAGGSGRRLGDGPLDAIADEGWSRTLEWNLGSLFRSNRAAVRSFLERGVPGSVVNMGSVLGFSPSPRYFATHAYAAAKAAIIGLTKSAAAYYARDDVRFNVVAPALVETPMAKRAMENSEIQSFIRRKQPLDGGRAGRAEDLDDLVVYLLSERSRFVTGQVFAVDGGWTVSDAELPEPRR